MKLTAFPIVVACCILLVGGAGASGGIITTEGDVQILDPPPPDARQNRLESSQVMFLWEEQDDLVLPWDIKVDIVSPGAYDRPGDLVDGIIPAGTRVRVHFLHADMVAGEGYALIENARIHFSGLILGIITRAGSLGASDFLGEPATRYGGWAARGLSLGAGGMKDRITLEDNMQWLDLDHICASAVRDELRVITTFEDGPILPEPLALSTLAVGGLGLLVRRRRCA